MNWPVLTLFVVAGVAACAPAVAQTAGAERCSLVVELNGKSQVVGPLADLRVLNGPDHLPLAILPGGKLQGVACDRESIVPDARDDRVPTSLGVPLYLSRDEPGATVALERTDAGFRVRLVDGSWSADEESQVVEMIRLFNSRLVRP